LKWTDVDIDVKEVGLRAEESENGTARSGSPTICH
jgi:hypothetical protein